MPSKGDPLKKDQIELIKKWIEQGADFGDWTHSAIKSTKPTGPVLPKVPEAPEPAMSRLNQAGARAMPLARDTNLVNVDFRAVADQIGDSHLKNLAPVKEQLAWLNLASTKISDTGLGAIAGFPHLSRLHLEKTVIGDAAMAHIATLKELEYLNLYGTKVTDAGIEKLKSLKNLKRLYVWQTDVSKAKAAELAKAIPGLRVDTGWEAPKVAPKPVKTPKGKAEAKKDSVPEISEIMKTAHKGGLLKKVLDGKASAAETKQLVAFYEVLAAKPCPKGDAKSWKQMTSKILTLSKKVEGGDKGAIAALKTATNCKACHTKHK